MATAGTIGRTSAAPQPASDCPPRISTLWTWVVSWEDSTTIERGVDLVREHRTQVDALVELTDADVLTIAQVRFAAWYPADFNDRVHTRRFRIEERNVFLGVDFGAAVEAA